MIDSVLIITETWQGGGLETHVLGEIRALFNRGVFVHFATGNWLHGPPIADTHGEIPDCRLILGLPIAPEMTLSDFVECVSVLRQAIDRNRIKLVHAHPYLSLIPSLFAAALEGVPLATTIHGPNTVQNSYGPLYDFVLRQLVLPQGAGVFAVSQEIADLIKQFTGPHGATIIPNSIHIPPLPDNAVPAHLPSNAWLLVTRLDEYKAPGALDFIRKALTAGVPQIDIAGNGPAMPWLQRQVECNGLAARVRFLGWKHNARSLMPGYAGVAGMGRVVLEAIASGRPVILVGYDGVKGVVDHGLLHTAAYANFSGRNLPTIDASTLARQFQAVEHLDLAELRETVAARFDEQAAWDHFLRCAQDCRPQHKASFQDVFDALLASPDKLHQPLLGSPWFLNLLHDAFQFLPAEPFRCPIASGTVTPTHTSPAAGDLSHPDSTTITHTPAQDSTNAHSHQTSPSPCSGLRTPRDGSQPAPYSALTSILNAIQGLSATASNLLQSFLQVQRDHGFFAACALTKRYLEQKFRPALYYARFCPGTTAFYQFRAALLRRRIKECNNPSEFSTAHTIRTRLHRIAEQHEGMAIFVISDPIEWSIRHEKVLELFKEKKYLSVLLSLKASLPYFFEHQPSCLETNCIQEVLSSLSTRNVALFAATPLARSLAAAICPQILVYDAPADALFTPVHCGPMRDDHIELIRRANVVLFPSAAGSKHWTEHVKAGQIVTPSSQSGPAPPGNVPHVASSAGSFNRSNEFIVSVVGTLNEMLDWELLARIADDGRFRLCLIGPEISATPPPTRKALPPTAIRVLKSKRVTHVDPRYATTWMSHLTAAQVIIVPPVASAAAEGTSCGKIFDYLFARVPILVVSSQHIDHPPGAIIVKTSDELFDRLIALSSDIALTSTDSSCSNDNIDVDLRQTLGLSLPTKDNCAPLSFDNLLRGRVVNIINLTYYDWDGVVPYRGGAERYIYDLAHLLMSHGMDVHIMQPAKRPFCREYHGLPVHGIQMDCSYDYERVSHGFRKVCSDADLVIASPVELASELKCKRVIGINHGIHWDHRLTSARSLSATRFASVFKALRQCRIVVSVDTNFINWTRTCDYGLSGKTVYIPNYVDRTVFRPIEKSYVGRIRCLYPRRLYEARGLYITIDAFDYLFKRFPFVDLELVGQADSEVDAECVQNFIRKNNGRVAWRQMAMDEMHSVYEASHIVLIPTMYAEGTSLSCLEGMATNNAIVATNVGGLPNLVIHGFNGLLTNPTAADFSAAVESLLSEPSRISEMAKAGLSLVSVYDKRLWEERWRDVVLDVMLD